MVRIALIYKSLVGDDFKVLASLEKAHITREHVSLRILEKLTSFHEERLLLVLSKLHELGLVKGETIMSEKVYRLTYLGYDMLALRALVKTNIIEAMGDKVGEGKESEIYLALTPSGRQVAVKFLRIGRTSFRQTARTRTWAIDRGLSWYVQSKIAAEREFKALKELHPLKAWVPEPIGYNRHVVVIEFIDGVELYRKPSLENPESALIKVLDTIAIAYHKASIVHGDLSEYNVLVKREDETPFIIDWPQYVYRDEPQSLKLLRRDVYYIVKFFVKTYGLDFDVGKALEYVLSWKESTY